MKTTFDVRVRRSASFDAVVKAVSRVTENLIDVSIVWIGGEDRASGYRVGIDTHGDVPRDWHDGTYIHIGAKGSSITQSDMDEIRRW